MQDANVCVRVCVCVSPVQGGDKRERWCSLAHDEPRLKAELNLLNTAQQEQAQYRQQATLKRYIKMQEQENALVPTTLVTDEDLAETEENGFGVVPTADLSVFFACPEPSLDEEGARRRSKSYCGMVAPGKVADVPAAAAAAAPLPPRKWRMSTAEAAAAGLFDECGGEWDVPEPVGRTGSEGMWPALAGAVAPPPVSDYRARLSQAAEQAARVLGSLTTIADDPPQPPRASHASVGDAAGGALGRQRAQSLTAAMLQRSIVDRVVSHRTKAKALYLPRPDAQQHTLAPHTSSPQLMETDGGCWDTVPLPTLFERHTVHTVVSHTHDGSDTGAEQATGVDVPGVLKHASSISEPDAVSIGHNAPNSGVKSDAVHHGAGLAAPAQVAERAAAAIAAIRDVGLTELFAAVAADEALASARTHNSARSDEETASSPPSPSPHAAMGGSVQSCATSTAVATVAEQPQADSPDFATAPSPSPHAPAEEPHAEMQEGSAATAAPQSPQPAAPAAMVGGADLDRPRMGVPNNGGVNLTVQLLSSQSAAQRADVLAFPQRRASRVSCASFQVRTHTHTHVNTHTHTHGYRLSTQASWPRRQRKACMDNHAPGPTCIVEYQ